MAYRLDGEYLKNAIDALLKESRITDALDNNEFNTVQRYLYNWFYDNTPHGSSACYRDAAGVLTYLANNGIDIFDLGNDVPDCYMMAAYVPESNLKFDVNRIGSRAFLDSDNVESVEFSSKVKSIGTEAFAKCDSLETVTFNEGLTTIDDSAFRMCGLTNVVLPKSIANIGNSVFDPDVKIQYAGSEEDWKQVKVLDDSLKDVEFLG